MKGLDITLDTPSQLPLVAYFPDINYEDKRHRSEEIAAEFYRGSSLAQTAVTNVLHENYKRRLEEANATADSLRSTFFDSDGTFKTSQHANMDAYVQFRCADAKPHASIGERSQLFLQPIHLPTLDAYEIFARSREDEADLLDLSFARDCLRLIAESPQLTTPSSLPKLTRKIATPGESDWRVVTAKLEVGSFYDGNGDEVELKSRQAGLMDYTKLSKGDKDVMDTLTRYNRSKGRSLELTEARQALQQILQENPEATQPVVESLYLSRVTAEAA